MGTTYSKSISMWQRHGWIFGHQWFNISGSEKPGLQDNQISQPFRFLLITVLYFAQSSSQLHRSPCFTCILITFVVCEGWLFERFPCDYSQATASGGDSVLPAVTLGQPWSELPGETLREQGEGRPGALGRRREGCHRALRYKNHCFLSHRICFA